MPVSLIQEKDRTCELALALPSPASLPFGDAVRPLQPGLHPGKELLRLTAEQRTMPYLMLPRRLYGCHLTPSLKQAEEEPVLQTRALRSLSPTGSDPGEGWISAQLCCTGSAFLQNYPPEAGECKVPGPHSWNHPEDRKAHDQRWLSLPGTGLIRKNQVPRLSSSASQVPAVCTRHHTRLSSSEFESLSGTCFLLCPLESCGQEARRAGPKFLREVMLARKSQAVWATAQKAAGQRISVGA
ncbi:hypothetical protein GH733_016164 [Mirounga leonina]|nr:hypothetical protein GH733_016164 [Mirounga leonina]